MVEPAEERLPKAVTDAAARWLSESFDGQLPPDRQAALDAWLAADPRHRRAYTEMQDLWAHMGGVADTPALRAGLSPRATRAGARPRPPRVETRRRRRWAAPAAAAGLAAALLIGTVEDWPTRLRADAMTATGERRTVALPDGSSVQLDTASAIAIDFAGDRRVVRLLKGEAAFSVTKDPSRPFTVEAAGGSSTALGTRFLVRREDGGARVVVTEHRVRVAYPAPGGPAAVLAEGDGVTYGPRAGLGQAAHVDAAQAMAWTDGVLVFKDAPLADVVAAIGRYHRGYIQVVGDAQALRVSGVFRIDDPVAAIGQLQRSLGLRSARLSDRFILVFA